MRYIPQCELVPFIIHFVSFEYEVFQRKKYLHFLFFAHTRKLYFHTHAWGSKMHTQLRKKDTLYLLRLHIYAHFLCPPTKFRPTRKNREIPYTKIWSIYSTRGHEKMTALYLNSGYNKIIPNRVCIYYTFIYTLYLHIPVI